MCHNALYARLGFVANDPRQASVQCSFTGSTIVAGVQSKSPSLSPGFGDLTLIAFLRLVNLLWHTWCSAGRSPSHIPAHAFQRSRRPPRQSPRRQTWLWSDMGKSREGTRFRFPQRTWNRDNFPILQIYISFYSTPPSPELCCQQEAAIVCKYITYIIMYIMYVYYVCIYYILCITYIKYYVY